MYRTAIVLVLMLSALVSTAAQNAGRLAEARAIAGAMNRQTLAAQVFLTAVEGKTSVPEQTRLLLADVPAGGIMLFGYNTADPETSRAFIEELCRCVTALSLTPFVASDQEGGAVQRFRGRAALPPPLSYWEGLEKNAGTESAEAREKTLAGLEADAAAAGTELRRIGITLNLAPVAEPLNALNRPFLKERAYGPDVDFTARAVAAFVRAMNRTGVAAALKHFPGNSGADPHRSRAVLNPAPAELAALVEPFRRVIAEEAPAAVMVSHVIVPSWDSKPSSLSSEAVRHLRDLGFGGIVLSDDFAMAAAGAPPEICTVEALKAGVDMIMAWPGELRKLHRAVLNAMDRGELAESRVREAAERIIYQKLRYGLIR